MGIKAASFIGWSNTGKTTFIEACAAKLHQRGIRVAAVKCISHDGSFNLPGKDSTRFFEAGAQAALISETETHRISVTPSEWGGAYVESLFPGVEAVLIEGKIVEGAVRVLVGGAANDSSSLKKPMSGFDVIITEHPCLVADALAAGLAVCAPGEAEKFVDQYLIGGTMETRDVTVSTGGVEVPINGFIKETIENVVLGLVRSLKKTNLDEEIVIRIGKKS
ncbi:MAG: molybdopterin-guanine dinucleotide biosynthesis protein MobB [Spirochaetia bacterium]|jgi:molybdopterin-guanine dinucleotide biosynthesis protein MobB|nr:molybdopterin-guanine dinucleotide biosynthesis protein MobB [Spirochaetia bacterium]